MTETAAPPTEASGAKKLKILYVITKSNFGGAQRYVYDLASHALLDTDVAVMCGMAQNSPSTGLLVTKLEEKKVRTVILPWLQRDMGMLDVIAFYKMYRAIKDEHPDVLHLNSSKAGGLGALAGRLAGVPHIVFTAHGWAFNEDRNILQKALIWLASVATILLCHKVICVSAYDRMAFAGWFFENKLAVIHNAVPPDEYADRDDARTDLVPHADLYANDIWVGSVAELTKNKNIELAIHAVAKARSSGSNIFYAIVGDGEERLRLEDLVQELKLDENVRFLGFVSDAQKLIKAFDMTILPSRKEGLPYMALESLQAGVPIIASNVGGIPEIVRDGENGILCESENTDEFAEAIIALAKDENLRRELGSHPPTDQFETMLRETFAMYH